jgi:hypothetical protein
MRTTLQRGLTWSSRIPPLDIHLNNGSTIEAASAPSRPDYQSLISSLTDHYLAHRTAISRTVYLTLFFALLNRIRSAISNRKPLLYGKPLPDSEVRRLYHTAMAEKNRRSSSIASSLRICLGY